MNEQIPRIFTEQGEAHPSRTERHDTSSPGKETIPRRETDAPCALSFGQQRLWFLDQLQRGSSLYNAPRALRIRGPLFLTALQEALDGIVARHEVLRTIYVSQEGVPRQIIGEPRSVGLRVVDLQSLKGEEQASALKQLLGQEALIPFDLSGDLMLRALLVQLGPGEHVLLLVTHHIASDGWSTGILLRELAALYTARSAGAPSPLPELPIQYADFALWQRRSLQGQTLEKQLSFWVEHLGNDLPALNLPTDRARPAVLSYRGARRTLLLPAELRDDLKGLSRAEGATLFMTLLAAFQVLLHRYTGQEGITVGTPIAGRRRRETETLIGFFVNTLVLRGDLAGDPTFRDLLRKVRETALRAYSHQDIPFELLVEKLRPERNLSRAPLVDVDFQLRNLPARPLEIPGLEIDEMELDASQARLDLSLEVAERPEGLRCDVTYSTDLFDEGTIERMLGHYQTLLESIVAKPDDRLPRLRMLTPAEQDQLRRWSTTKCDYPRDKSVHQLFEYQAEQRPDATALVLGDDTLTYAGLDARANQLARYLRRAGIQQGDAVGLCTERSFDTIIAMLAILKARGVYMPLDPTDPRERLALLLDSARARMVLTQERLLPALAGCAAPARCLDVEREGIARESRERPESYTAATDPAYVMFTSGSTGTPKGVVVPHRAIVRLLFAVDYATLDAAQILLQLAPVTFDASTFEIWGALLHGGRCVLFPDRIPTPHQLGQVLSEQKVTTLWLTSSLFNSIVDIAPAVLSSVRQLLVGGEALSVPHVRKALRHLPATRLVNGYGPTEGTTFTCCYQIPRALDDTTTSVPIGKPIGNTEVCVLDAHRRPVPVGIPGELYIGGDGLANGYLNSPELTAEKFIPHPFCNDPIARVYKTGDLVRFLPDGNIDFLGRLDDQVKIRGFRIEPGEVEAALSQHPAVKEVAVLARESAPADRRLVAYVVARGDGPISPGDLHAFLSEMLPAHMIPSAFIQVAALPLTASGKLDRKALPIPHGQREDNSRYVAPRNSLEEQLAEIWGDLLGAAHIGIHDDFFELGGHSLMVVQLFAEIERLFGRRLPLATLFEEATVRHLASVLSGETGEPGSAFLVPIQPAGPRSPLFCLHGLGGEVLVYHNLARRLGPDQPVYGIQARGIVGPQPPHFTVEDAAASYIEEMRSTQPKGPYYLAGFSAGGVWAFEVARQLRALGEKVGLLALLDSGCPGYGRLLPARKRVLLHLTRMRGMGTGERLPYFLGRIGTIRGNLKRLSNRLAHTVLGKSGLPRPSALQTVERATWIALDSYIPQRYPGRVTLFWARDHALFPHFDVDPRLGWSHLAEGGVELHEISGHHGSIIREPALQDLAEELRACLFKAQEGVGNGNPETSQCGRVGGAAAC